MLVVSALLAGCSLFNPHVTWKRPQENQAITLDTAISYANRGKDAYKAAIGDQAIFKNTLASALIPLGAATLGAAVAGVDKEVLVYLALTGAAGFGIGTWLTSEARDSVYLAGTNGLTCAVEAVLPLYNADQDLAAHLEVLHGNYGTVFEEIQNASNFASQIEGLANNEQTPQTKAARQSIATAQSALDQARQHYEQGVQLVGLINRSGQVLIAKVDDIGAAVDKQIKSTVPDLQSLPTIIAGLAQSARTLAPLGGDALALLPGAEVGAIPKEGFQAQSKTLTALPTGGRLQLLEQGLDATIANLNRALGPLSAESTAVAAIVEAATKTKPTDTLKKCGVEEVETGFTMKPAGPFVLKPGQNQQIAARGGKAPFKASLSPQPADGVTLFNPLGHGSNFVIVVSDKAKPAEYKILFEDAVPHDQTVALKVVAAQPPEPNTLDTTAGPDKEALDFASAVMKLDVAGRSFEVAGGKFTVHSIKAQKDHVHVKLAADGMQTSSVSADALQRKIAVLADRGDPFPKSKIEIDNHEKVKDPGMVVTDPT